MKWAFSVNAMNNLDGPRHATPFRIITPILDNATGQRVPATVRPDTASRVIVMAVAPLFCAPP